MSKFNNVAKIVLAGGIAALNVQVAGKNGGEAFENYVAAKKAYKLGNKKVGFAHLLAAGLNVTMVVACVVANRQLTDLVNDKAGDLFDKGE